MSETIDYFFTTVSPFAWLGHQQLVDIATRHGKAVAFRPVSLGGVWEVSGAVPLGQRTPARQRYRLIELQRFAELRGVDLKLQPKHFPTDPTLADLCVIAAGETGKDPSGFAYAAGEAVWSRDLNIADEAVLRLLLADCGHDADRVISLARGAETAESRAANTRAAIEAGAIGSPAYVYRGEVFWGQDRLDLLERMIETGRQAYSAQ